MLGDAKGQGQAVMLFFHLGEFVPKGNLLREIEEKVSFGFVRDQAGGLYSDLGRPGIDPIVIFKMVLIGYLYGITSERLLAQEIRLNMAYRWFLHYTLMEDLPTHSVLSKARRRYGEELFDQFLTEIIQQCQAAGLVSGQQVYLDSTLVAANASLDKVASKRLVRQLTPVSEHMRLLREENDGEVLAEESWDEESLSEGTLTPESRTTESPAEETWTPEPRAEEPLVTESLAEELPLLAPATERRLEAVRKSDIAWMAPNKGKRKVGLNELQLSVTDPGAALIARGRVPFAFYHKLHVAVDGGPDRIITAIFDSPGSFPDESRLAPLVRKHAAVTGDDVMDVVADTKYGVYANFVWLEEQGLNAHIPVFEPGDQPREFSRDLFTYDEESDTMVCPAGQTLRYGGPSSHVGSAPSLQYRGSERLCGACPSKSRCCQKAKYRTVTRVEDDGLYQRVRDNARSPAERRWQAKRMVWIEPVMAELKDRHGLRRASLRGNGVQIQAYCAAIAYNVKKLVKARGKGSADAVKTRLSQLNPSFLSEYPFQFLT